MTRLSRPWRAIHKRPAAGWAAVFVAGMVFWGAFNWSLEATNTETFCISCHVMKEFVYEEFRESRHFANRTGVRATCPDCHVPRDWIHMVMRKIGATNELYHWLRGSIDTRQKFEAKRLHLARHVWDSMAATDSRECRNCHGIGFMNRDAQAPRARWMHELADGWGKTCIDCHKGVVHALPRDFDKEAEMDALHDRMEADKVECRLCHENIGGPPPGDDWD